MGLRHSPQAHPGRAMPEWLKSAFISTATTSQARLGQDHHDAVSLWVANEGRRVRVVVVANRGRRVRANQTDQSGPVNPDRSIRADQSGRIRAVQSAALVSASRRDK